MKIAIITDAIYPFTLGGSEIRNYEIAKRLAKKGHEVHIYGAKLWKGEDIINLSNIIVHGVFPFERLYKSTGKRDYTDQPKLATKLFFELLKEEFDIIDNISFVFLNCYSTKLISMIKKIPLVFTWHQYFGDYLLGYFGKTIGKIPLILERLSTKLTRNNIAVSKYVKSELTKRGIKRNIKVIYNGANVNQIKKIKTQRKKFDLIFVGRLNYQKNLKLLIYSVKLIKKNFPEIRVCIVGSGEEEKILKELIGGLKLEENFYFTGALRNKDKIFKYLKSSKIFVLPSLLEGFPLTVIEANACGLPVITTKTNHNNTSEYIINNENGLIIEPDPKNFSDAISNLLKNEKLRKKMSKTGIKKTENFDWNKIADEQEKYYQKILNKGPK